jgi:hypothetical protein
MRHCITVAISMFLYVTLHLTFGYWAIDTGEIDSTRHQTLMLNEDLMQFAYIDSSNEVKRGKIHDGKECNIYLLQEAGVMDVNNAT